MVSGFKPIAYEQACVEARRWIEDVTEQCFPRDNFRKSLRDGVLLCKLVENLSGIKVGKLNPIPRSLAWMDNLTIFLNICRFIGLKKSQLFRVDDLAAVRNQDLPLKVKQKEESRKERNVLITIFWLGRLAYSFENYQGPLPDLDAFANLINNKRPPEMVDQRRNKLELNSLSGSETWPRTNRSSDRNRKLRGNEKSLEYFEHMRQGLIPRLSAKVKEKATMYDRMEREAKERENSSKEKVRRSRSRTNPLPDDDLSEKARRTHSSGALVEINKEKPSCGNKVKTYYSVGSITRRTPLKMNPHLVQNDSEKHGNRSPRVNSSSVKYRPENIFQYNNKPVINDQGRPTVSGTNASKRKNDKSEYVSVGTLIQQWSSAEGQEKKPTKLSGGIKKNRHSLPTNFPRNNYLANNDEPQLRRAKSMTTDMCNKSQVDYLHKASTTSTSTKPGFQGTRNIPRGSGHHDQGEHAIVSRRRSEPITKYATSDHSTYFPSESRKQEFSMRGVENRNEKEIIVSEKRSSQANKTYSVDSHPQLLLEDENEKLREDQSDYHYPKVSVAYTRRRSDPIKKNSFVPMSSQEIRLGTPGTYGNREVYYHVPKNSVRDDWSETKPIIKYATVPSKQRKAHENESLEKNETKTEIGMGKDYRTSFNWRDTGRQEKSVDYPNPSSNKIEKKKTSLHRLPTYKEATEPLQGTDLMDGNERRDDKQTTGIERPLKKSPPSRFTNPSEPSIEDKKGKVQDQKRKHPVEETFIKQSVLPTKTAVEFDSLFNTNNLLEAGEKRISEKHLHHAYHQASSEPWNTPLDNKAIEQRHSIVPPNGCTHHSSSVRHSSKITSHVSYFRDKADEDENIFLDVNDNALINDQTMNAVLASQQRRRGRDGKRGEEFAKEQDNRSKECLTSQCSTSKRENTVEKFDEQLRQQQKFILDEDFKQRGRSRSAPDMVQEFTKQDDVSFSNVIHDNELVELVAAEEKYWKEKVEKKAIVSEDDRKKRNDMKKEDKQKNEDEYEKQKRVDEMLREYKLHEKSDSTPVDYSEMTDTLRAEEEFLAQEAEKLLKQRFQEKSKKKTLDTKKLSQMHTNSEHKVHPVRARDIKSSIKYNLKEYPVVKNQAKFDNMNAISRPLSSPVAAPAPVKSPSNSSDDINLKPEVDQAYHNQTKRISRTRSPVYVCSGCRLPVERDICLYVSELQSYWHEKCFRCSVCHSSLIRGRSTPKIRVMYSRIHCENCLSNRKTGGQWTMV